MNDIDALISSFKEVDSVKRYLALKKAIVEKGLADILKEAEELQTSIKKLPYNERKKVLERAKELFETYSNDPLVINLKCERENIEALLDPLSNILI